jgi:hypothetical protein
VDLCKFEEIARFMHVNVRGKNAIYDNIHAEISQFMQIGRDVYRDLC